MTALSWKKRPGFSRLAPMPPTTAARWMTTSGRAVREGLSDPLDRAQVVLGAAGHEDVGHVLGAQARHHGPTQEPGAAGDHDAAAGEGTRHRLATAASGTATRCSAGSRPASQRSAESMRRTSPSNVVVGRQPSSRSALLASPQSSSTSVGRK